jgi:hypothetical protein
MNKPKAKLEERLPRPKRKSLLDNPLERREHRERQMLAEFVRQTQPGTSDVPTDPNPQTSGLPVSDMASMLAINSTSMASMLAISETYGLPSSERQRNEEKPEVKIHGKPQNQPKIGKYRRPNEVAYTSRMDADLMRKIKSFCAEYDVTLQEFWTGLASHHLENMASLLAILRIQPVASMLAHDDMMILKTCDDIIMRYQSMTGQKWTRRDDREGASYNDADIRLIEIAFITTIERKLRGNTAKQPIKSFSYFKTEIDLLIAQKKNGELPEDLSQYHKYVLSVWEKRIKPLRDQKWPPPSAANEKSV